MVNILYTDIDHYRCHWLQRLVGDALPRGIVFRSDIVNIPSSVLKNFSQCHFFCGIGGWPLALAMAGWPDDSPVWTGSCPCQPFSMAGDGGNYGDERDYWPEWFYLITKHRPPTIFGEQVTGPLGKLWIHQTRRDLESVGYRFAAANLPASGVGALHERNRFFWVADTGGEGLEGFELVGNTIRCISTPSSTFGSHCGLLARIHDRPDPAFIVSLDGIPRPVGVVRSLGDSIVPEVAVEFIQAYVECL